ncbi:Uncharacterized protein PECH_004138 [Penicillium ucsense]|uniref:Alpha/beta hydrolase fold-3 domain-containing protein n=1 Tax=Penicillium ucsense TaxID=2839758 RepID=A0A8J8WB03_9EURO|nr:Uncharacterized protein PECM_005545 [Penicillium ucsense]KAF7737223.1 Uncharacterized protein PECH_004138 [Penicillium ucsense]
MSTLDSTQVNAWFDKTFDLPVGNNGSISIRLTRSPSSGPQVLKPGSNVIMYLPSGPLGQDSSDLSFQRVLAAQTSAIVVTVNYRLGAYVSSQDGSVDRSLHDEASLSYQASIENDTDTRSSVHSASKVIHSSFFQYPTPIHDTLSAFDWIQTHLSPAQLCIYGSHIGGSLALMLALTEAQSIKAVATHMPVCDWTSLDTYCTTQQSDSAETHAEVDTSIDSRAESHRIKRGSTAKRTKKTKSHSAAATPTDLVPLLKARRLLFSSPERCFDAFASPMLFLRSAGTDVPRAFPEYSTGSEYPVPVLKSSKNTVTRLGDGGDLLLLGDLSIDEANQGGDLDAAESDQPAVRRRKALSRWPPYGLDYGAGGRGWGGVGVRRLEVILPWVRLGVVDHAGSGSGSEGGSGKGSGSVLADQGEEMVSIMRRACFFGKEKGVGEKRVILKREAASSAGTVFWSYGFSLFIGVRPIFPSGHRVMSILTVRASHAVDSTSPQYLQGRATCWSIRETEPATENPVSAVGSRSRKDHTSHSHLRCKSNRPAHLLVSPAPWDKNPVAKADAYHSRIDEYWGMLGLRLQPREMKRRAIADAAQNDLQRVSFSGLHRGLRVRTWMLDPQTGLKDSNC